MGETGNRDLGLYPLGLFKFVMIITSQLQTCPQKAALDDIVARQRE